MATTSPTMNKIERAHQMYRDGKHLQALGFYTEALSLAKTKSQKIALHSNRAACYLKLHDFDKAAEECTSVLELDHDHTGALMLRAQTLVTLKEYQSALFDVNRLIELNPSSEVYENLQARLKTQLSLAPIPESEAELEEEDEEEEVNMIKETEPISNKAGKKANNVNPVVQRDHRVESGMDLAITKFNVSKSDSSLSVDDVFLTQIQKTSPNQHSNGWTTIPKPKGHSNLDYSRWDQVEDDSSEDDEDDSDDESEPQYRFRVKTIGVRPAK